MDKVGELVYLASEKNSPKNNGAEKHPTHTFQIPFVYGRYSKCHEQGTCEQDEGTEGSKFDIEDISDV